MDDYQVLHEPSLAERVPFLNALGRYIKSLPGEVKTFSEDVAEDPMGTIGGVAAGALQSVPTPPSKYLKKMQEMEQYEGMSPQTKGGIELGEDVGRAAQSQIINASIGGTGVIPEVLRAVGSEIPYMASQSPEATGMSILADLAMGGLGYGLGKIGRSEAVQGGVERLLKDEEGSIRAFHGGRSADLTPENFNPGMGIGQNTLGTGLYTATDPVGGAYYASYPGRTLYELELHPGRKPKEHKYIDYQAYHSGNANPPKDYMQMFEDLVDPEIRKVADKAIQPSGLPFYVMASKDPDMAQRVALLLDKANAGEPADFVKLRTAAAKTPEYRAAEKEIADYLSNKGYAGARGLLSKATGKSIPGSELATFNPSDFRVVNQWPTAEIPEAWMRKAAEFR